MKNRIELFLAIIAGILLFYSCKKDSPKITPTLTPVITGPYLYLGGSADSRGVYWKVSLLDPSGPVITDTIQNAANITSIVISDNTRYMTGGSAGYWINDSFVAVRSASQLNLLAISGTTVYTAGFDLSLDAAQWTNTTETADFANAMDTIFPRASWSFGLTGIALSGSNVLVSGSWVIEGEPGGPDSSVYSGFGVLFTNGAAQLLPYNNNTLFGGVLFRWTNGVAVSGNDIYVPGTLPDTISPPKGGFWKNGVWNNIDNGLFRPSAIATSDTNIVIAGYTYTLPWNPLSIQAAYWHNGKLTTLNGTTAVMVALYDRDIYVLGQDNSNNIVVWKNGTLFKTLNGAIAGNVSCMTIGN
jgi:hypothetical protein